MPYRESRPPSLMNPKRVGKGKQTDGLSAAFDWSIVFSACIILVLRVVCVVYGYYASDKAMEVKFTNPTKVDQELCWIPRRSDRVSFNATEICNTLKGMHTIGYNLPPYHTFKTIPTGRRGPVSYLMVGDTGEEVKLDAHQSTDYWKLLMQQSAKFHLRWWAQVAMHPPGSISAGKIEPYYTLLLTILLGVIQWRRTSKLRGSLGEKARALFTHPPGKFSTHHIIKVVCVISMVAEHFGKCFDQKQMGWRLFSPPTAVLFYFLIGSASYGRSSKPADMTRLSTFVGWWRVYLGWVFLHYVTQGLLGKSLHVGTLIGISIITLPEAPRAARWVAERGLLLQGLIAITLLFITPIIGDRLKMGYGSRTAFFFMSGFLTEATGHLTDIGSPMAKHYYRAKVMWIFFTVGLHVHYIHLSELLLHFSHGGSWTDMYSVFLTCLCIIHTSVVWFYRFKHIDVPDNAILRILAKGVLYIAHYSIEIFVVHMALIDVARPLMGVEKCTGTL